MDKSIVIFWLTAGYYSKAMPLHDKVETYVPYGQFENSEGRYYFEQPPEGALVLIASITEKGILGEL